MKTKEKNTIIVVLSLILVMIVTNIMPIASLATNKSKEGTLNTLATPTVTLKSDCSSLTAGSTVYVDVYVSGAPITALTGTLSYDTTIFSPITSKNSFQLSTYATTGTYGTWNVDAFNSTTNIFVISESSASYYQFPDQDYLVRIPLQVIKTTSTAAFSLKTIQVDNSNGSVLSLDQVSLNLPTSVAHTVTLDLDGGTYTGNTTVSVNEGKTQDLGAPTKDGYSFQGWQIVTSPTTATLSGTTITMGSEDVSVKALWQVKTGSTYTMIVDANGGTYTGNTVYEMDLGETQDLGTPTKSGSVFQGWEIVTSPTTATLNGTIITMGNEDIVVRAKWLASSLKYTVTLNLDGGTYTGSTIISLDEGATQDLGTPTKTGYTFNGWVIETTATSAKLNGTTVTMGSENIDVKATWTENLYLKAKTYQLDATNNSSYIIGTTKEYVANDQYILNIPTSTTLATFVSNLDTNGVISVKNTSGTAITDTTLVGTGMTLEVTGTQGKIDLLIVVAGDLDGDGKCTITDLSRMNNILNQSVTVTGAFQVAADMDYSGKVTISDLARINQYITGIVKNLIKINN